MVSTPGINPTVILTGPTASGKSSLSLEWASLLFPQVEIINADSMLVYRGMDIGTAKPTSAERGQIPHHLIDIREPNEPFTAGEFVKAVHQAITEIEERGRRALIVGGSGFYLKALLYGLWEAPASDSEVRKALDLLHNHELLQVLRLRDPASALRIGETDRYRLVRALEIIALTGKTPTELESAQSKTPDPRLRLWVLDRPRAEMEKRISERTNAMLESGWIDEVERLRSNYPPSSRALNAVGYKQIQDYLEGRPPLGRKMRPGLSGLRDEIVLANHQLVKSQRTFFRRLADSKQWFELDRDRARLREEFLKLYT